MEQEKHLIAVYSAKIYTASEIAQRLKSLCANKEYEAVYDSTEKIVRIYATREKDLLSHLSALRSES